ncbi:MAG: aminopeptidase P family protein [Erysipelotrichaceae bacterium]|nr:aminopeptidase P family protein [Erysipelotrichaceae bacterium]
MNYHVSKTNDVLSLIEDGSLVLLTSGRPLKKSADENYPFCANRNFLYLTGIDEPEVVLVLIKTGRIRHKKLFIKKADPQMEKWVGKTISAKDAHQLSGIEDIAYLDELKDYLKQMLAEHRLNNVYIDDEEDELVHFAKDLLRKYAFLKQLKVLNIYEMLAAMRSIKEKEEVTAMRQAITVTNRGIMRMLEYMRPGMLESEIEAHFDFILRSHKVDYAFNTIAAGGSRGTTLHYMANNQPVLDQELILFDLGATHEHYCADISRTFPINGKFTPRQKTIYEIVLLAQKNVIKAVKPGVTINDLQRITVETYQQELKRIGLIKDGSIEEVRRYYYHGVSHSLGLDTHDVGLERNEPLVPGCVITVEPGLYLEEEAIGIRIEDDVLVTEKGCEVLSKEIIKEVSDIEAYFQRRG